MERNLNLSLKDFPQTPNSLRDNPSIDQPRTTCRCNLPTLFHHYYLDKHGRRPPNPSITHFEYREFIANCDDFRFVGDGIGASTSARRNISSEFGQAFFRWFLHEHLNITYFAHMDSILDRQLPQGFGDLRINRVCTGDVPDYLCAENVNCVYLGEAKGRYKAISFSNSDFAKWRNQFSRVQVLNGTTPVSVKGFIVGTRYATEANRPTIKSGIFAEDPKTPGERPLAGELALPLGLAVIAEHYVSVFQKLNQILIATALANRTTIPAQVPIVGTVWKLKLDIRPELLFVGGYYPSPNAESTVVIEDGKPVVVSNPFRLDVGQGIFFGIELNIFKQVASMARVGIARAEYVKPLVDFQKYYGAISLLRDGTILGPVEIFQPIGLVEV